MSNKFAKRLTSARESAGYTKKKLSEKLGDIHPSNVSNWESGKNEPKLDLIIKISQVLNVSVEFLVGVDEDNSTLKEPTSPAYGQDDREIQLMQKELSALIKANERLSALADKLQDGKSRLEEERREIQKKYNDLLLKLPKIKAGEDVDL